MTPKSSWLRSTSHDKFAAAMLKCQHSGAFCAQDGFCHYGDCFKPIEKTTKLEKILQDIEDRLSRLEDRHKTSE